MLKLRPLRVLVKALILFLLFNFIFAALDPAVGKLSIFNRLVTGRSRFPAVNPAGQDLRIGDAEALFRSHVISSKPKPSTEYRVLLSGDSQTWGWLLPASQTLAEYLNRENLTACNKDLQFYNLAYPTPSVLRDFFYIHEGLEYDPDLIIWMVTLDSFRPRPIGQLVLDIDPQTRFGLLQSYSLQRYQPMIGRSREFADSTLLAQRRRLKSLVLLQMYGTIWDATGIDYRAGVPSTESTVVNKPAGSQVPRQATLLSKAPNLLTFDVLKAGRSMLGNVPMLVVNEPIPISGNSTLRYNSEYPQRSYDQYRRNLQKFTSSWGIRYLDYYDQIPISEFPAGNLHLTAKAEKELAKLLSSEILKIACP